MLRVDDLEVCLRITLNQNQRKRALKKLITAISWMPINKGKEIWQESRCHMGRIADSLENIQE